MHILLGTHIEMKNNRPMLLWLTGLSGAGKSTIADIVVKKLRDKIPSIVQIDGNVVREIFGPALGFDEFSRKTQIKRIQQLAKFLTDQQLFVIVSALYSHPELMQWNRANLPNYYEVLIDASLDVVMERDPRGLYEKHQRGEMHNLVGIDVPWHRPENSDLILNPSNGSSAEDMADQIISKISTLNRNFN